MNIHSIRIKMLLPILFLAVVLIGLLLLMTYTKSTQENSMKLQTNHYFEAISEVLNADRDIYQARLAQEKILSGEGTIADNSAVFTENAKQVKERFELYRNYLAGESELLKKFESFDGLYASWLSASQIALNSSTASVVLSEEFLQLDKQFMVIRKMLDEAGEELRIYIRKMESENIAISDIERYVEAISEVLNADRDLYQARLAQQKMVNKVGSLAENRAIFEENAQQTVRRFHAYRGYLSNEANLITPYNDFDILFNKWYQESKDFMNSSSANTIAQLPQQFQLSDQAFNSIRDLLDEAGETVRTHAKESEKAMIAKLDKFQYIAIVVIFVVFIASLIFAFYMTAHITKNIKGITRRIKEIAEGDGDLTQRIGSKANDELGDLACEFDLFVEQLRTIISSVQAQSSALGGMTSSLSDVSAKAGHITNALVDASDLIVSAANEMSMSNEQMAKSAKNTADEADQSSEQTKQGIDAVNRSNQQIINLRGGIDEALVRSDKLEESSAAIASVLEVIRKIAEQTNLLALNAAIEAARAGEQGRGFAVVADEVRTLATRTQDSTNEIETMIDALKTNVQASSHSILTSRRNVDATTDSFNTVVDIFNLLSTSFKEVQNMAQETSHATQEQSTVSESIMQNLMGLKEETSNIEEVSGLIDTHSRQISELYEKLDEHVGSFKV